MLKKILVASALAVAGLAVTAPAAGAAPDADPFGPKDSTSYFVSAFDPAAYGARSTASLIISPYGANQPIMCSSFHAQTWCYQVDPWGNHVNLRDVRIPTGSSEWSYRTMYVALPG